MDPIGLLVFAIFLALVLIAIIVPQLRKRHHTDEA